MYSEEEISAAVQAGIFSEEAVENFRRHAAGLPPVAVVHEERIRMASGLNDVLVALASLLLLLVLFWMGERVALWCGGMAMAVAAWGLAEVFTRQRQMALSSIVLMLAFSMGAHAFGTGLVEPDDQLPLLPASDSMVGYFFAALAGYAHWCRFRAPIAVTAAVIALLRFSHALLLQIAPYNAGLQLACVSIWIVMIMVLALRWDRRDRYRLSWQSDVAFWLYLLLAQLLAFAIANRLHLLQQSGAPQTQLWLMLLLYGVLALFALWTDRRALLILPLLQVFVMCAVIAVTGLSYGADHPDYGLAPRLLLPSLLLAVLSLLLAAFWTSCRAAALCLLPRVVKDYLPAQA